MGLGGMASAFGPFATCSVHIKIVEIVGFVDFLHCDRVFLIAEGKCFSGKDWRIGTQPTFRDVYRRYVNFCPIQENKLFRGY